MTRSTFRSMNIGAVILIALTIMLALCCNPAPAFALDEDTPAQKEEIQPGAKTVEANSVKEEQQDVQDTSDLDNTESPDKNGQETDDQPSFTAPQPSDEQPSDQKELIGLSEQSEPGDATLSVQSTEQDAKDQTQADKPAENTVAVYRLYNFSSGEHLYTLDKAERNWLASIGWFYEGIGWMAPISGNPVFRLYNPNSGDHHYTLDSGERRWLPTLGWRDEGIAFYSPDAKDASAVPVYRQFNPNEKIGTHNFTCSKEENDYLASIGWRAEGVGWYSIAVPSDFKDDLAAWKPDVSGDTELDRWLYVITKSNPTLASCFNYVKNFSYTKGTEYWGNPRELSDSVTISHAKSILKNKSGNCYQYAALFSWLARSLGYDSQVISGWVDSYSSGKAPHGWVEIKQNGQTYVCDPDMAHAMPNREWYMVTYDKTPIVYHDW